MELIVVPPLYFDVVDSYNTRMRPDHPYGRPDKMRAMLQWSRFVLTLSQKLGIKINFIDAEKDLYDMVFACDPGLWVEDIFIESNFWAKKRQPEVDSFINWFKYRHYEVKSLSWSAFFEGGDCVMVKNKLIMGYGANRTNKKGVAEVASILEKYGVEVVPIKRVTDEIYHLNSAFTYYPSAELLAYYPVAFEKRAEERLKETLKGVKILKLGEKELFRNHLDFGGEYLYSYALNAIENKGIAIQPYCHHQHQAILDKHGIKVIVPEDGSSEFERSGGSYRCLTMIRNRIGRH